MPNYTTNLNLAKPLQSEQYNVDVFNANADKIDQFAGQVPARALTADKLTTGAKINGVNFKGDTDIELPTLNKSQISNCILEAPNGVATYSGDTITVKSGLKILMPNGRNSDGTLRNNEYTLDQDYTRTLPSLANEAWDMFFVRTLEAGASSHIRLNKYYMQDETPPIGDWKPYWYQPSTNKFYRGKDDDNTWIDITGEIAFIGTVKVTNGAVTAFNPQTPINVLKLSDKSQISGWGMPSNKYIDLTLGASGTTYTALANGWVEFAGQTTSSNNYAYGLQNMTNEISAIQRVDANGVVFRTFIPVSKGNVFKTIYEANISIIVFRFIYAEGEVQ